MPAKKTADKITQSRLQEIPIAIIGMSALFPESKNLQDYWNNIVNEVDCISDVPSSRWNIDEYYDPDKTAEDKTYCKRGGFIPDVDFDPMEFGLPPNMLEVTDVHQLLSLLLAKEVLKDGGYDSPTDEQRKNTGVILGVGGGQKLMIPLISRLQYPIWERVLKNVGIQDKDSKVIVEKIKKAYVNWEENSFPGALGNIIAGRIANRLDLGGTNCVVDAACASSFSGIRMAVNELLDHRADMMITGGLDSDTSPYMYLCFSKTQAFTQDENSKPFDKSSSGMIMGEGMGMLLLKRLADAERDGDRVYAVIKGNGSSSDGKYKSIYAPRPEGQTLALERAYKDSGISPETISLIEAHGTGTTAGDMAEMSAINGLFKQYVTEKQVIPLASVKSQIGHTKNAAGAAGMVKTALALYHKVIPASINITEPNPELDFENSPFFLNTETRPWIHSNKKYPRRAGISAFGFGGTNFHFILEEYQKRPKTRYRLTKVPQQIILSATSPEELIKICQTSVEGLKGETAELIFHDLSTSHRTTTIPLDSARIGFVAATVPEAISSLSAGIDKLTETPDEESWELKEGVFYRNKGVDPKGKVVALFAGQGSPYLNMGKELVYNFPPMMGLNESMDHLFCDDNQAPLSSTVYPKPTFDKAEKKQNAAVLQKTENAQPAIGVFSAGQFQLLKDAGFKPDFVAGHSFGELTALWAAEVISTDDYLALAKARGKAMAAPDDPNFDAGSMLAVTGDLTHLEEDIKDFKDIKLANFNSNGQIVLAGPTESVKEIQQYLKKKKYRGIPLGVSAAFHTPLMGHAQKPFAEAVESKKFKKAKCQVYSNATAKAYPKDPKAIQKRLQEHILNSVLFKEEIENIYNDGGYYFIEFGPKSILTRLVQNILQDKPFISVALNASEKKESDRQFREAVVKLRVSGLDLNDIDPYEYLPSVTVKKKTALTLKLSGMNYVSDKTRKEFEEALNDGYKIDFTAKTSETQKPVESPVEKTVMESNETKPTTATIKTTDQSAIDLNQTVDSIERNLTSFQGHQNETLRLHEQFLQNQSEYSRSFFQIMQQQFQAGPNTFTPEVAHSVAQFHQLQTETLRIHEQYLQSQTEYSRNSFDLIKQQQGLITGGQPVPTRAPQAVAYQAPRYTPPPAPAFTPAPPAPPVYVEPPKPAPVAVPTQVVPPAPTIPPQKVEAPPVSVKSAPETASQPQSGLSKETLKQTLLEVVAEKTGYQADMLEIEMDMEADLGIDSIKRVEILNGIQEKLPDMPPVNPEELSELRTLAQIIDHMTPQLGEAETTPSTPQAEAVSAPSAVDGLSKDIFSTVLLEVVSEKTGYQADMLELGMDMEADLGIDSIKRVEILNGIQEKLPDMPPVNPEELSELRTLGQIVDHISAGQVAPDQAVTETASAAGSGSAGGDLIETIQKTLLAVVSEKTGYLEDMLELSMDMEADLGIDSIKRVEILNGMQEKLPDMPEVNPEELSELRTLAQIVEKMGQYADTSGKKKLMN